jgi:proteasome assembly chaperone (PAC2) family protein
MSSNALVIHDKPTLENPTLLIGLSGWMDGGEVSTGTIRYLVNKLNAKEIAEIKPCDFYLYNFPGSMEIASLFRPHCKIEDGEVKEYEFPTNLFFCGIEHNLILFSGVEPNANWDSFSACIFDFCNQFGVSKIYFVGSVAGMVPHTREPRLFCSVSAPSLKETLAHFGVKFSQYEGPASITTYMTTIAAAKNIEMVNLVSAVPAYVQGYNAMCISSLIRRLVGILDIQINLDDLIRNSEKFEKKLSNMVEQQPELADNIQKLEEDYDNEIFNNEMGDLKNWLEQKGVRLD